MYVVKRAKQSSAEQLLVDEYCDLRAKMKAWKPNVNPHAARFAEVAALILVACAAHTDPGLIVMEGERYKLPISARRMKRSIVNLAGFFRWVGRDRYLAHCPPTLATIESLVPKDKHGLYISESQTGNRTIGEPVTCEAVEARLAA